MESCHGGMSTRLKQRAVTEFLSAEKVTPAEIHRRLQAVYGENTVNRTIVNRWVNKFRECEPGRANIVDQTRSGWPARFFDCFWESQRVYITEFLEAMNTVNSARYIETIKTYGGGCVELGGQHRGFCCCMTMLDRTLLAQRLMLWRR